MHTPESIEGFYYQQGFNYSEYTPDMSVKLGGGCQASSLLLAARLMSNNKDLSMSNVQIAAHDLGLEFQDPKYATRISYASIPIIASYLLKDNNVTFSHRLDKSAISLDSSPTFYGKEAQRLYLDMPRLSNLRTLYGISHEDQIDHMVDNVKQGGLAIPLVHTNTLYGSSNPVTEKLFHAVVVAGFDPERNSFRILDPSPGFSHMLTFGDKRDNGTLKIRANAIRKLSTINMIAEKFHPLRSIDYYLPIDTVRNALRSVSTTII